MTPRIVFSALLLLCCIALGACSPPEPTPPRVLLPPGNLARLAAPGDSLNSYADETAPVQRPPASGTHRNPYEREFLSPPQYPRHGIKASRHFVQDSFGIRKSSAFVVNQIAVNNLTRNIESMTFLDNRRGFVSFAHSPWPEYAEQVGLNTRDDQGGVDLFYFSLKSDTGFVFENLVSLSDSINTNWWDSHPFAADSLLGDTLLVVLLWSSDGRQPFRWKIGMDGTRSRMGHSDLYYSFGSDPTGANDLLNFRWSAPRALPEGINKSVSNEGSPFVYCLCHSSGTTLFFSSNRDGAEQDYDLYSAPITIDFAERRIITRGAARRLPRNTRPDLRDSSVNSAADERFPFVPSPISDSNDRFLYYSSKRFHDTVGLSPNLVLQSRGSFDLYRSPLGSEYPCRPAPSPPDEIAISVALLDACDPARPVQQGMIRLIDESGAAAPIDIRGSRHRFILHPDRHYSVLGGSDYADLNDCTLQGDSILVGYYPAADVTIPGRQMQGSDTSFISRDTIRFTNVGQIPLPGASINYDELHSELRFDGRRLLKRFQGTKTVRDSRILGRRQAGLTWEVQATVSWNTDERRTRPGGDCAADRRGTLLRSATAPSETGRNGVISTFGLRGKVELHDTVYLVPEHRPKPEIELEVFVINILRPGEPVRNPLIAVYEGSDSRPILRESDKQSIRIKLECHTRYTIKGGSDYDGFDCGEADNRVLMYYRAPARDTLSGSWRRPLRRPALPARKITSAELPSEKSLNLGGVTTSNVDRRQLIRDTVYVIPHYYQKPPCVERFVRFKGIFKNVPYFQTGMWEVNTSDNLKLHLDSLHNRSQATDSSSLAMARWVELHPENSYWHSWDPDRALNNPSDNRGRIRRIAQYQSNFAPKVDASLDNMTRIVSSQLLPQFHKIDSLLSTGGRHNSKLIIQVEAYSDKRPVRVGWYTGQDVNYTEGELVDTGNGLQPRLMPLSIPHRSNLNLDNDTLSKLRAWYGYREIIQRLRRDSLFQHYAAQNAILYPEEIIAGEAERDRRFDESKIIILSKGKYFDAGVSAEHRAYTRAPDGASNYFSYDTVRRVNVKVYLIEFVEHRIVSNECCNKSRWLREIDVNKTRLPKAADSDPPRQSQNEQRTFR